ncbi:hypothetical protein TPHA_0H00170 [Tetrapisispora phaffii CBS 4417]|uniref:UBR-type domain-containing protein n=1 Tax=Tetrapisispora phaffii (strain ATCC 24235 / CBS 4417 / NBRC 1672 / NRRL Y-8282 / UCD 70-5) TaxID=1071381 RepID=G8BWS4_TETPH|nr:hypothetical protein TPHA_0H00170 [Tetrapisispora phaffii CBS 4417]CCE64228.1 hypothetical protein TPHA_0H00170 [Tetrapisispora phaffii CBS 4417]
MLPRTIQSFEMNELSASEYLEEQERLQDEARNAMPWEPNTCTYELGALRQQLYACRDHGDIGICYSCSIQCHTSCDLVELFTKRHFTCDCGTERDQRGLAQAIDDEDGNKNGEVYFCSLRKNREKDIASGDNVYGHNFKGLFCDCATEYDPDSDAVMLQCVAGLECDEDWYHDYCIMNVDPADAKRSAADADDSGAENVLDGFPDVDSFDSYICWKCIAKNEWFFNQLITSQGSEDFIAHKLPRCPPVSIPSSSSLNKNGKRTREDHMDVDYSLFLKEGYSSALAKLKDSCEIDSKLRSFLTYKVPFLIEEVPVYEQHEDATLETDVYDVAMNSIGSNLQHEPTVNTIIALQQLKAKLGNFFKTFVDKKDIVKEEDIREFFNKQKEDSF